MRVLCVDENGVLGGLPSPVLLPEYGERFLHVTAVSGDVWSSALASFLHAGNPDESREVWVLWRSGMDRYAVGALLDRLKAGFSGHQPLAFQHLLVERVSSGAAQAQFFSPDRELDVLHWCAEAGAGQADWTTVSLGIGQLPTGSARLDELATALALRFWMHREQIASRWPETGYRLLFSMQDDDGNGQIQAVLRHVRTIWLQAYEQLAVLEGRVQAAESESHYLSEPELLTVRFAEKPGVWPALVGSWWQGKALLGRFHDESDGESVRGWTQQVFGRLSREIGRAYGEADALFAAGRRALFLAQADCHAREKESPEAIVQALEARLATLDALPAEPLSRESLMAEADQASRRAHVALLDVLPIRPTRRMALLLSVLTLLILLADTLFHQPWAAPLAGGGAIAAQGVSGWIWYAAAGLMLGLAFVWAVSWCQVPVRRQAVTTLQSVERLWERAKATHSVYVAKLNHLLERITVVQNLNVARAETARRSRRLAQIRYHMGRLHDYLRAYGTQVPEVVSRDDERMLVDESLPENDNMIYFWRGSGATIRVSGWSQPGVPVTLQSLADGRLAGLASVEVRCIAPHGRQLHAPEHAA